VAYRGNRPRLARIELAVGVSPRQQIRGVETGKADYAMNVPRTGLLPGGSRRQRLRQLEMPRP
jgi:hypothetical protein